ncbi:MAG: HAD family phosphatase [Oscillospiraceae bacterium]|nr:HAD family phosphatase [Oscillospiraceae bacterium]
MIKLIEDSKAVIFDMDNTILDSHNAWGRVDEEFFRRRGIEMLPDYCRSVSTMSFKEAADYTIKRFSLNEDPDKIIDEWFTLIEEQYANFIGLFNGAKELLLKIKESGRKLALATAASPRLYIPALKNNGIYELFDAFACTEETERGKGFPDVYLLAAQRLGVKPCDCVVFEDIIPGVKAAGEGGMKVCAFLNPYTKPEWDELAGLSDFSFKSYSEIV